MKKVAKADKFFGRMDCFFRRLDELAG